MSTHKPRRMSRVKWQFAQEECHKILREGIIELATGAWRSASVIVPKPEGKFRFCVDYRDVNEATKKDAYQIPNIDDILDKLRRAKYISTIELSLAHHQVEVEESSREVTGFGVPGMEFFQFKRMPVGLTNAPATFQRLIDSLIGIGMKPHVFAYLDDIIIATETFEEHMYWLERVLKILIDAVLVINQDKCHFCCPSFKYLGYLLDCEGLHADPDKVRPILEYPPPTNLKELRQFLDMMGWYARFIENIAVLKIPLVRFLRKDAPWD